jgi:hypothetical protein
VLKVEYDHLSKVVFFACMQMCTNNGGMLKIKAAIITGKAIGLYWLASCVRI